MIEVHLSDGTRRMLDEAKLTLTWEDQNGVASIYTGDQLRALVLVEPEFGTMPGLWRGMGIVGFRFTDTSDLRIEVPLPIPFVEAMIEGLPQEVANARKIEQRAADTRGKIAREQANVPDMVNRMLGMNPDPGNGASS